MRDVSVTMHTPVYANLYSYRGVDFEGDNGRDTRGQNEEDNCDTGGIGGEGEGDYGWQMKGIVGEEIQRGGLGEIIGG